MVKLPRHCGSLSLLLILLMLVSVCPAQAATGWDRTRAGLQPVGYDHTSDPYAFSVVHTHGAPEKRFNEIVAVNTSEEASPSPSAAETTADPEFDSFWAWLWDYLYNGASITLGVGLRQAELQVTRKIDGDYGKIVQRDEEAYFISYSTRPTFFKKSNFAYLYLHAELFHLQHGQAGNKQGCL
ncbi:MAG TPA: hypothetical protein DCO77_04715 [Nitrospiraceae bacterium]|nr:hypothetical protein [Nitrospiraceae bacterium]